MITATNRRGIAVPLPYQEEGVGLIERFNGRVLLADQMGLGKTLQALWALQRNPSWLPALIVCPSSVKYNWEYEARHNCGFQTSVCEGQSPPTFNRSDFSTVSPITIINYDILPYWVEYLKKLKFKTIVPDECQFLQSRTSKRTVATRQVARGVERVIAMSGTPIMTKPADLWPVLNILWPDDYNSFWSFADSFCDPKWLPWGWTYKGASNLDQLHAELKAKGMIRRLKADVLKDLPEKIRCIQPCEMSDPAEYRLAKTDFMSWLRANNAHKLRAASKAEKLMQVGYLLRIAARLKMRSVVNWANEFLTQTDEKLILFAIHRKAIDVLQRRINTKSVIIDGSVTGRDRQRAVDQFQNDSKTRLCIGQLIAAGVGITLTAASTVGMVEFGWRPADHLQAEDRPHRIGQKNSVWIHYFVAAHTIEEKLCRILQDRQEIISSALDGQATYSDLNLYEELLRELERETA